MTIPPWSHSALKTYITCPKKYEGERVTKEVVFKDNESTLYGKDLHRAAEEYIRDGKPLEEKYRFIEPYLTALNKKKGVKLCEHKMGLTESLEPCEFFAPDVWVRGVADLIVLGENKAWLVDYKAGKSKYADPTQLDLMAYMIFKLFPELDSIFAMLLFVVSGEVVRKIYKRAWMDLLMSQFCETLEQRRQSYETGVWNPKPNGLCRQWCGVKSCLHNGER